MKSDTQSKEHLKKSDRTLVGWSERLRALGLHSLAAQYDTDIVRDFELVHELGLPAFDSYIVPVRDFLDEFNSFRKKFVYDRYNLALLPLHDNCRKYSLIDFARLEEGRKFIVQNIRGMFDKYMLRISEFETNMYGGSIMSDDDIVLVEMAEGLQTRVAYGTSIVISGTLTSFGISTKYSTQNQVERMLIWKAMKAIIRDAKMVKEDTTCHRQVHSIRGYYFLKGYFEFAYTQREDREDLRLIFFDLKLSKAYYNLKPSQLAMPE